MRADLAEPTRPRLEGTSCRAALRATAGTAAPAPAAAPRIHAAGCFARKMLDNTRMMARPGRMKQTPPSIAPAVRRRRHAQKIASCVEAGPGRRFVEAIPSSNSSGPIHPFSSTQRRRSSAMWVGGPPKPMNPSRAHSFAIVDSDTRWTFGFVVATHEPRTRCWRWYSLKSAGRHGDSGEWITRHIFDTQTWNAVEKSPMCTRSLQPRVDVVLRTRTCMCQTLAGENPFGAIKSSGHGNQRSGIDGSGREEVDRGRETR